MQEALQGSNDDLESVRKCGGKGQYYGRIFKKAGIPLKMVEGMASVCEDMKTKEKTTMTNRLKINGTSLISRRDSLSHNPKKKKRKKKREEPRRVEECTKKRQA